MGLLSCSVLAANETTNFFGRSSRSVLHTAGGADDDRSEEEGMVRYYGKETTYDTLPSLHSLGEDSTSTSSHPLLLLQSAHDAKGSIPPTKRF
jgi:hypothetical protein